jgi:glycine hydroxymethyltransferase
MSQLSRFDPEAFAIMQAELQRQQNTLELIASENHASAAVLEAGASVLSDKYAEGYPHRRYYNGCENADRAEQLAIDRAKALFGAEHANVQPHCGTSANIACYMASLGPCGKIMGMDLSHGGHLSHGLPINYSGIYYEVIGYTVNSKTERLDMDEVRELAVKARPRLIIAGASAYSRIIDFAAFAQIAQEIDAILLADIAHIAGLVVGKVHPSPVPHADFVTTTTHKTLRGPRGALILCRDKWAKKVDSAVFPGLQGGPFVHTILAKAVAFAEAAKPEFAGYAVQIVANAQEMANVLMEKGWRVVTDGTDNHMFCIDLRSRKSELTGHEVARWLSEAGIIANKNKIPFDPRPPAQTSGVRFGSPATTSRGMKQPQMRQIALWIDEVLSHDGDEAVTSRIAGEVRDLCQQFPVPNQEARS